MGPVGNARFHLSKVSPYTRGTFMFQPLDWLEGGFRYTDIANRPYASTDLSGNQSYKDKSIDFKVRLAQESNWLHKSPWASATWVAPALLLSRIHRRQQTLGQLVCSPWA